MAVWVTRIKDWCGFQSQIILQGSFDLKNSSTLLISQAAAKAISAVENVCIQSQICARCHNLPFRSGTL
jgi:hypothetical protein